MNGLFNAKDKVFIAFFKKNIKYDQIFEILGEILTTFYIVDLIIQENTNFQFYWEQYTEMFLVLKNNPQKYNTTSKNIKKV